MRHEISSGSKSVEFYVVYRFHPKLSATQYECKQNVGRETYRRLDAGSLVSIVYYPANPAMSRLANTDTDNYSVRKARLGGFACLIIGFWIIYPFVLFGERFFHERRIMQRINHFGILTDGVVINREAARGGLHIISYSFPQHFAVKGQFEGKQQVGSATYSRLTIGSIVAIKHDSADPGIVRLADGYADNSLINRPIKAMSLWLVALVVIYLLVHAMALM